jgi:hypothetical protein
MKRCKIEYNSYLSTEWDLILHGIGFLILWTYKNYADVCMYLQDFKDIVNQMIN